MLQSLFCGPSTVTKPFLESADSAYSCSKGRQLLKINLAIVCTTINFRSKSDIGMLRTCTCGMFAELSTFGNPYMPQWKRHIQKFLASLLHTSLLSALPQPA